MVIQPQKLNPFTEPKVGTTAEAIRMLMDLKTIVKIVQALWRDRKSVKGK